MVIFPRLQAQEEVDLLVRLDSRRIVVDRDKFHVLFNHFGGLDIAEIFITTRFGSREYDIVIARVSDVESPPPPKKQIHGNDLRIG